MGFLQSVLRAFAYVSPSLFWCLEDQSLHFKISDRFLFDGIGGSNHSKRHPDTSAQYSKGLLIIGKGVAEILGLEEVLREMLLVELNGLFDGRNPYSVFTNGYLGGPHLDIITHQKYIGHQTFWQLFTLSHEQGQIPLESFLPGKIVVIAIVEDRDIPKGGDGSHGLIEVQLGLLVNKANEPGPTSTAIKPNWGVGFRMGPVQRQVFLVEDISHI